ncbi:MAG: hypothetical protein LIP03_06930 [Bacteroidales bacterium]|nr:hypothetical protein [Bacteroidales bacterium]
MITRNDIVLYAKEQKEFSCANLYKHFASSGVKCSKSAVLKLLKRMVDDGELIKPSRGCYRYGGGSKRIFSPYFDEEMAKIEWLIRKEYPFMDNLCIWNINDVKRISHYVAALDVVYVEVDKEAVEGVFTLLDSNIKTRKCFVTPTINDYARYIKGIPAIVVKPIVSRAPLLNYEGIKTRASLEKILVDAVIDADFSVWHDFESLRLYDTAFDGYNINVKRMLGYAQRRGRKQEITEIINDRHQIYD